MGPIVRSVLILTIFGKNYFKIWAEKISFLLPSRLTFFKVSQFSKPQISSVNTGRTMKLGSNFVQNRKSDFSLFNFWKSVRKISSILRSVSLKLHFSLKRSMKVHSSFRIIPNELWISLFVPYWQKIVIQKFLNNDQKLQKFVSEKFSTERTMEKKIHFFKNFWKNDFLSFSYFVPFGLYFSRFSRKLVNTERSMGRKIFLKKVSRLGTANRLFTLVKKKLTPRFSKKSTFLCVLLIWVIVINLFKHLHVLS